MQQFIVGLLLLISFFGLVYYATKGGNLVMGMLIMAVAWTVLSLIGNVIVNDPEFIKTYDSVVNIGFVGAIKKVFQDGPEGWGNVLVNFLFGAWFGRILLHTNIASTIIRKTVELGGDKPQITGTLLLIVTAAIFTGMFGTGAVLAIGVIVLPILLSLGISKKIALVTYMLAVGAGLYINPVIFNQYQAFFLGAQGEQTYFFDMTYLQWGFVALGVQLVLASLILLYVIYREKNRKFWKADIELPPFSIEDDKNAPNIALISPFIPVVLAIAFNIPVIFGFLIGSFFAMYVCGMLKGGINAIGTTISKTFYDGVVDTAPMVAFVLIIPMFNKASELTVPYFNALLGGIIPKSTLFICIAFAILSPMGLFRGPLTLAGAGAATLGILKGLGFSTLLLFPLFYATTVTMNISCCITQSWIVWGLNYTKVTPKEFLKTSIPVGFVIVAILSMVSYVMFGNI